VHHIIGDHLPEGEQATVVYVDYEPVAARRSHLILQREEVTDWAGIVQEDLRHPQAIFDHPETARLIDFTQPVALLMVALLHFVGPDDRPDELMATYRDRLAGAAGWPSTTSPVARPSRPPPPRPTTCAS
jgi:hypothetical protein